MRLEYLCDVDHVYHLLREVPESDAGEGRIYGEGTSTFTGRLSGTAHWSNFPMVHRGFANPDSRGVIEVTGGGVVLYTLVGLSNVADGSGVHVMKFRTNDEHLLWLNEVIALGEGSIDAEKQALSMRYYECHVDHLPGIRPST